MTAFDAFKDRPCPAWFADAGFGVFIHWEAEDNKKIFDYNFKATKMAIANAMQNKPSADEMIAGRNQPHPFQGF